MTKKHFIGLLILLMAATTLFSQEMPSAPTLQVGLSGISYKRGNLDADLIAEIISEKQKEVEVRLVKNMLLENLGVDNGLFYSFIDHGIEILTTEKDENTRVKNLLENVVNLSFVVIYADYYVRTLKKGTPEWDSFASLALGCGVDSDIFNQPTLSLKDFSKIQYKTSVNEETSQPVPEDYLKGQQNKFVGIIIDLFAEVIRQNEQLKTLGLLRTNYLQNYLSMNAYLALENESEDGNIQPLIKQLKSFLSEVNVGENGELLKQISDSLPKLKKIPMTTAQLDGLKAYCERLKGTIKSLNEMVKVKDDYKVIAQRNIEFQKFIRNLLVVDPKVINASGDKDLIAQFELFNTFLDAKVTSIFYEIVLNKRREADIIFNQIADNLQTHIKYFGLIKSLSAKGTDWEKALSLISKTLNCEKTDSLTAAMKSKYRAGRALIVDLTKLTKTELDDLEKVNGFVDKLKFVSLNQDEYQQIYEHEIRPSLIRLAKYSDEFLSMGDAMSGILNCIGQNVVADLRRIHLEPRFSFVKILSELDEFDNVNTYSDFINQLSDAGDVFSDEEMRKSINKVISFVKSYIKVARDDEGNLALNLDVEGFLASLQRVPYNKFRPFQFHFTVGTNTTVFNGSLDISDTEKIYNYSFIGEKIGVKFKLYDYQYTRSFSKGETFRYWRLFKKILPYGVTTYVSNKPARQPVVSNIHLLAYGSGILYNLVNTGTTKDFNSPLLGAGIGITFFNDLDLNFSVGRPLMKDKSLWSKTVPSFFNVGFDIQFLEYFDRLSQKRKASQIQKNLAKAKK